MLREEYKILELLRKMGRLLLQNGSEINRIEKSTVELGQHFGYKAQCFATLTCIIITVANSEGETFSIVDRIDKRSTNLDKVYKVYQMINNINSYNYTDVLIELDKIENEKSYTFITSCFGYIIGAGFFVFLFKGNYHEFIVAMITGFALSLLVKISSKLKINTTFSNIIYGICCALVPSIFARYHFIKDVNIAIISSLMIMVPGVSFINAIRDLFSGDLVTSLSRILEVALIGLSLSIGSALILKAFII